MGPPALSVGGPTYFDSRVVETPAVLIAAGDATLVDSRAIQHLPHGLTYAARASESLG